MIAAIAGCLALAVCIALVLLAPMTAERRRLRPIANAHRLTALPEYVRAMRARTRTAVITIALLVVMFACSIVVAARPTGLPTAARQSEDGAPEDVMLCIGGPLDEQAVGATLSYFADRVDDFRTERIGLTSPNRRVVPLTRDYQYAKSAFTTYARPDAQLDGEFSPAVSYVDYAESVDDLLALCLTGFPSFDQQAPQRRSLIYVGPGGIRAPDDARPSLFTADAVKELVVAADVQVNALVTDSNSAALSTLAADTGGQSFAADAGIATHLDEIRDRPPAARPGGDDTARRASFESPDLFVAVALLAALALAAWPVVRRR